MSNMLCESSLILSFVFCHPGLSVLQSAAMALGGTVREGDQRSLHSHGRLQALRKEQMMETLECLLQMESNMHSVVSMACVVWYNTVYLMCNTPNMYKMIYISIGADLWSLKIQKVGYRQVNITWIEIQRSTGIQEFRDCWCLLTEKSCNVYERVSPKTLKTSLFVPAASDTASWPTAPYQCGVARVSTWKCPPTKTKCGRSVFPMNITWNCKTRIASPHTHAHTHAHTVLFCICGLIHKKKNCQWSLELN